MSYRRCREGEKKEGGGGGRTGCRKGRPKTGRNPPGDPECPRRSQLLQSAKTNVCGGGGDRGTKRASARKTPLRHRNAKIVRPVCSFGGIAGEHIVMSIANFGVQAQGET